jgi:hypothetical protein
VVQKYLIIKKELTKKYAQNVGTGKVNYCKYMSLFFSGGKQNLLIGKLVD